MKENENRARSRSRDPNRKKKFVEYKTVGFSSSTMIRWVPCHNLLRLLLQPFDEKGRCHYHKNVQLAVKKNFGGGWKILHEL